MSLIMTVDFIDSGDIERAAMLHYLEQVGAKVGVSRIHPGASFEILEAHEALADEADWNADVWAINKAKAKSLVDAIDMIYQLSPLGIMVSALWAEERPTNQRMITISQMKRLILSSSLGTRTRYVVQKSTMADKTAVVSEDPQ